GKRERVDPGELVADEALAARVRAVVEALDRREQQVEFGDRRFQLISWKEAREDHETIGLPGLRRVFDVHRVRISKVRSTRNQFRADLSTASRGDLTGEKEAGSGS